MVADSSRILKEVLEKSFQKYDLDVKYNDVKEGDLICVGGNDRLGIICKKLEQYQLMVQYFQSLVGEVIETIVPVESVRKMDTAQRMDFYDFMYKKHLTICDNQIMTDLQKNMYMEEKYARENARNNPRTYAVYPTVDTIESGTVLIMQTKDNKKVIFTLNNVQKGKIYCKNCLFLGVNKLYTEPDKQPICSTDNILWVTYANDKEQAILMNCLKSVQINDILSKDMVTINCKPKSILFVKDWVNNDEYILKYQKVENGLLVYSGCVSFNNSNVEKMNYSATNSIEMCNINVIRYATDSEKQIYNNFYAEAEIELVPFRTKVLVSNGNGTLWIPGIYGFETYERNEKRYVIVGGQAFKYMKIYKYNKSLIGTRFEDTPNLKGR